MDLKEKDELGVRHSFKLWVSFLVWLGISLLSVGLVMTIMYKNPENLFAGYEDAKATLTVVTGIVSLIVSTIALYINWITTSLILLAGFKVGGNKEVTYRSVLYYFLKNSWIFAIWIALIIGGTLIVGTGFVSSIPSAIITGVLMLALYLLIMLKIGQDFKLQKKWVYIIFAVAVAAIIVISLLYTGKIDYSGEIG